MTNNDDQIVQAQLAEAQAARESAKHDRQSAENERKTAQAAQGPTVTKQPDDVTML